MTPSEGEAPKSRLVTIGINALVMGMALSIPALIFAAFWFNNGDLLYWIVLPVIFFMAG